MSLTVATDDQRLTARVSLDLYDNLNSDLSEPPTHLYFITGMQWVKVGLARYVDERLASLQCGCPFKLSVAHKIKIPRAFSRQVERHTHRRLRAFAAQGEWFDVEVKTAIAAAEGIVRQARALRSIMAPGVDDWRHQGPPHSGADFIYLVGGIDIPDKRLLPF